ncbi:major facilitator superfamily domain-containing protein [Xylogone sp. PMI_703]|nr:major facilitator superfamily domain-containing protein [Xylogone sp. PMI_703]
MASNTSSANQTTSTTTSPTNAPAATPALAPRPADPKAQPAEKSDARPVPGIVKQKGIASGEVLPGWTRIISPFRRKMVRSSSSSGSGEDPESSQNPLERVDTHSSIDGDIELLSEVRSDDQLLGPKGNEQGAGAADMKKNIDVRASNADDGGADTSNGEIIEYKVYKRRWFGLFQLVLLNIIVSWDWLTYSANSTTTARYYNISTTAVNWISTAFLFSFVVAAPFTIYILHRGGPKPAIICASVLILLGNWIRYAGTRAGEHGNYGAVMFGQVLTGLAQPFVLSAPTRYSDMWFTNTGRIAATAIMSLANPLGGALAQLIDPIWADDTNISGIPNMVLYISIISSVATIPSFFLPAKPPTPCAPSSEEPKLELFKSLRLLARSPEVWMIMIPFTIYVSLFNTIASLTNQFLQPYSYSETNAGIAGGILIIAGLVAAAITSPIIDRNKSFVISLKIAVPIIALCYLTFIWAPQTRTLAAPFIILGVLGAASFSMVPVILEFMIEITHPISPEVTTTIGWASGQLFGGIFIIICNSLRAPGADDGTADDGSTRPPGNMYRALVFQGVLAMITMPIPLFLGLFGRSKYLTMRRVEADREAQWRNAQENGEAVP